ncbi:SCP2 domain-containing protein [Silanimonas sp.]|jgi:ubiquinone biosynthesis protein UbiJ|uniref:SCP2 domain-containing protein n=1 Tax=Silanimonas sp. TaxID=1929290 RepID=UPI0037C81590
MTSPRSPLDALKPLAGRLLETALNRALSLDPETRAALARLDGQRLQLHIESPPLAMELRVDGEALRVGPAQGEEPDLSVRAGIGALLGQLPFLKSSGATPVGKVRISGDAELARQLQRLAEGFDPDWEQPFADALGPVIGPQVAKAVRAGLREARVQGGAFAKAGADYLTEESRDLVPKAEQQAFFDDVDALRDRVERLAARVARHHASGATG